MSDEIRLMWNDYQHSSLRQDDDVCRVGVAKNEAGECVLIYELSFDTETTTAVRKRLEYETARFSTLSLDRIATPLHFEFNEESGRIVFPWTDGKTLADWIACGDLSVLDTLLLADDLLDSLSQLHDQGLVLRCLRPDEITLEYRSIKTRPFIGGFGPLMILNCLQNTSTARTIAQYASPEALGALEEDVRASADLYSLGIVLFECLTGQLPFCGASAGDLVFHHMTSPVPELTSLAPDVPRQLNDIVLRLLQKHPRDRYQSAAGVRFDIQQVVATLQGKPSKTIPLGMMDRRDSLIEPAFVGRANDLALLQSKLRMVEDGQSHTALVTAASGLGKSRLLLELSREAVSRGFRVLRSQGQNQQGLAPLASLAPAMAQCLEAIRQDDALRNRLRSELSEFARELQAVVPEIAALLGLQVPAEHRDDLSDRRIAVALAAFLGNMGSADKPLLILLDDMQWADDLTLTMLECWHLTSPTATLLIVGTRPAESTAERLRHNFVANAGITLDPLGRKQHDMLLESMAGAIPPLILTSVWGMSAGNPFIASAVLRGLVEAGTITASGTGWSVDEVQLKNLQMSGEAAEILKQRLIRLSDESQRLLAVGAILGKEFSISMAAELAGLSWDRAVELLIEPRRNYLVWERASDSVCSFMHDQIREAVLTTLSPLRRAEIHRRAAVYLSHHEPERIFNIAFHHDASGRADLAKNFAIEAAEQARASHALESAEQQYRIAMRGFFALCEEPDFRVLHGLGDVLMLCGRYREAETFFERAVPRADSLTSRAQVTLKLGELAFKEDRKDRATELWESALCSLGGKLPSHRLASISTLREIAVQAVHSLFPSRFVGTIKSEPSVNQRLIWRLHSRLAYAYWFSRSKAEVLYMHLRGMNLAERYQPTSELAQAYSEHAPAMSLIPLSRRGIAYARRSLQIRTEQNDIWGQGQSIHCLAIALHCAAKFEECVHVGRRSIRILERAGDYWEKHTAQYQVASSLYRLGRFTEAAQLAQEAYDSGLAVGDFQACGIIVDVWARATNGDVPPTILQNELQRPRCHDVQGQSQVSLAKAVCLISEQHFEDAVDILNVAMQAARKAGVQNTYTAPMYAWRATALRGTLENRSRLTRSPRRVIIREHRNASRKSLFVALRFRNDLPHALRECAWAEIFQNRNRLAVMLLKKSIQIARRQSAEYEVIQSELLLQRMRVELGERDANDSLEQAERHHSVFGSAQLPQKMFSSLSLVDRFDGLLESGRKITLAIDPKVIVEMASDSARRLLRCNFCEVMTLNEHGLPTTQSEIIRANVQSAVTTMDAVVAGSSCREFRSLMTCPVVVRSHVTACLVVGNSEVRDLFGPNEMRIVRYLATITGAALENADGFRSLQELNANLEGIVEERTAVVEARSRELQQTADSLRKVQTQLAAARDAAESASRAKSDFLAHMSHEIRTPIGAVLGFTELLLQGDAPLLPEQVSHLQRVLSNGNHLHRLLNDLLDHSRIEAGRLTIESIECSPYAMIYDILSALQSRAMDKELKLSLRINGCIPEKILTDPTRLRQILTNLIGNSIKFTSEGGVSLLVETDASGDKLLIHVQDTGPGIEPAAQQVVFEPFKQADASVVRKFGGTGLGLPISRKLAKALGGDIQLASQPGVGSTFTVTIATGPLEGVRLLSSQEAEATLVVPVADERLSVNLNGIRILIADDVEANREFFAHVLRREGAECHFARDGQQAVNSVSQAAFDLVLMDMQMPVMDGYTATNMLRKAGFQLPIISITANGTDDDRARCRTAGCTSYLTKPISISRLLCGVAEQLGRLVDEPHSTPLPSSTATPILMDRAADTGAVLQKNNLTLGKSTISLPTDPIFRDFSIQFLRKVETAMPEILAAIHDSDHNRLSEIGHWMKGTGGTVGLQCLTEIGIELQSFAAEKDFVSARLAAIELGMILERLLIESSAEAIHAP